MDDRPVIRALLLLLLLGATASPAAGQAGTAGIEWPIYGGDFANSKFSPLDEIRPSLLDRAEIVWSWDSVDNPIAERLGIEPGTFKATPTMVDGALYVRTTLSILVALDPATGEEIWSFDPESYAIGRPANLGYNSRGVAHHRSGGEHRIFLATGDAFLWAIDAATGEPIPGFGAEGRIDLTLGLDRDVDRLTYQVMSPPLVIGDRVVVGASINDFATHRTAPRGDVRAFDVGSGEEVWRFRTIPRPGEVGHETWESGWEYTGNTNVWTVMSADEELGLVYLPVGTPTNDWYGGHRLGDNLFAESLVAVDAATGERRWHFQLVHHGVWDYDLPAAPTLMDVEIDGRQRRIAAQVTKQGFVYTFDRVTGEPVWPIVERPVPPSTVPGESLSPTQPFPTRPPPFERQGISSDDLIDFTPELRAAAERIVSEFDHGPLFQPPSLRGTINLPGWGGGANWHGAAADPETGFLYVPSRTSPMVVQLVPADPAESDLRYRRGGERSVAGPMGMPLFKPPYVRLTAIDMKTGDIAWQVPLGDGPRARLIEMGLPDPGPLGGGGFTGPLLTPSALWIGHSGLRNGDARASGALLAVDRETGTMLGEIELPGAPTGAPMTYWAAGRQHIVVAYTGASGAGLAAIAVR